MSYLNYFLISICVHVFLGTIFVRKMDSMVEFVSIERGSRSKIVPIQFFEVPEKTVASQRARSSTPTSLDTSTVDILTGVAMSEASSPQENLIPSQRSEMEKVSSLISKELHGVIARVPQRFRRQIEQDAIIILGRDRDDRKWTAKLSKSSGLPMLDKQIMERIRLLDVNKRLSNLKRDQLTLRLRRELLL